MALSIGFGQCNKKYIFILLAVISKLISQIIMGLNYSVLNPIKPIFKTNLKDSPITYFTSTSFFSFFIGFICKIISNNIQNKLKNQLNDNYLGRVSSKTNYIVYNHFKENIKEIILTLIFIGLIFIFSEVFDLLFYANNLEGLDYWMFEILILKIYMILFLKKENAKHQKLSLYICVISSFIIKFISNWLISKINEEGEKVNVYDYIIDRFGSWFFILLFIFLFLIMNTIRPLGNTKAKYLMDILFISEYSILMLYGGMGLFLCLIYIGLSQFFKIESKILGKITDCFQNNHFGISLLSIILFGIANGLKILFDLIIIKELSPFFMFAKYKTYYLLIQIILLINIKDMKVRIDKDFIKFYSVEVTSDIICFFGFLIYLELIEIRCKGLNSETKKKIYKRSIMDSNLIDDDSLNSENNEEEEEDGNENSEENNEENNSDNKEKNEIKETKEIN